ncbi:alpha/beta hydrolase family protein [Caulobacter endophyticus]|uniref:alpha/beta hydrolase family protein n=1 Tax=Caulobacter endophyticus TaxID=2172652 RepID=UPI00240EBE1C|nr:hypothetical protein [Caulobacter endophyticus]MDG2528903.1 hypothetical protein [Caulobacter endophyticus]
MRLKRWIASMLALAVPLAGAPSAGVSMPTAASAGQGVDPAPPKAVFWQPASRNPDYAHCAASRAEISPDGAFVALWRPRVDDIRTPVFDLSVLRTDCLAGRDTTAACVVRTAVTNATPSAVKWSADSRGLYVISPQIDLRRLAAPDFSDAGAQGASLSSDIAASAVHLRAPPAGASLESVEARLRGGLAAARPVLPGHEVRSLRLEDGDGFTGLGLNEADFAAVLLRASGAAPLGLPFPWLGGATLQQTGQGLAIWQNGELSAVRKGRLERSMARGAGVVVDAERDVVVAVFREDGVITPVGQGPAPPRILDRREAATAAVWDYSQTPDGRARVAVISDINGGRKLRLEVSGRRMDFGCPKDPPRRRLVRTVLDLGAEGWPLPARLYAGADPKALVVFLPGGPGSSIAGDAQLRRIQPLLDEGYDVLVVGPSGTSGEGLPVVSRLGRAGGEALDRDARLVLAALEGRGLRGYRHRIVVGESFGGMSAMALHAAEKGEGAAIDGYLLGAPWLAPRDPASWAKTRGFGGADPAAQAKWDRAMVGLDWSKPDDAMRTWARTRAADLARGGKVTIIYGEKDPTFLPADVGTGIELVALAQGDHASTLGSTAFTQALLDAVRRRLAPAARSR